MSDFEEPSPNDSQLQMDRSMPSVEVVTNENESVTEYSQLVTEDGYPLVTHNGDMMSSVQSESGLWDSVEGGEIEALEGTETEDSQEEMETEWVDQQAELTEEEKELAWEEQGLEGMLGEEEQAYDEPDGEDALADEQVAEDVAETAEGEVEWLMEDGLSEDGSMSQEDLEEELEDPDDADEVDKGGGDRHNSTEDLLRLLGEGDLIEGKRALETAEGRAGDDSAEEAGDTTMSEEGDAMGAEAEDATAEDEGDTNAGVEEDTTAGVEGDTSAEDEGDATAGVEGDTTAGEGDETQSEDSWGRVPEQYNTDEFEEDEEDLAWRLNYIDEIKSNLAHKILSSNSSVGSAVAVKKRNAIVSNAGKLVTGMRQMKATEVRPKRKRVDDTSSQDNAQKKSKRSDVITPRIMTRNRIKENKKSSDAITQDSKRERDPNKKKELGQKTGFERERDQDKKKALRQKPGFEQGRAPAKNMELRKKTGFEPKIVPDKKKELAPKTGLERDRDPDKKKALGQKKGFERKRGPDQKMKLRQKKGFDRERDPNKKMELEQKVDTGRKRDPDKKLELEQKTDFEREIDSTQTSARLSRNGSVANGSDDDSAGSASFDLSDEMSDELDEETEAQEDGARKHVRFADPPGRSSGDEDSQDLFDDILDDVTSEEEEPPEYWFTLDVRGERAGEFLPLLGRDAAALLLAESERLCTALGELARERAAVRARLRETARAERELHARLAQLQRPVA